MRVLLDTCVLSEIRHPQGNQTVKQAVASLRVGDTFLSAISVGEIANGIARLGERTRRKTLTAWLDGLERHYADRILSIDAETARLWGVLTDNARRAGRTLGTPDSLIAATARRYGLHVMTRNVSDVAVTGALIVNPWATD